jgi:outer membrane immunogenic protein
MSHLFTKSRRRIHPFAAAGSLLTAALAVVSVPNDVRAADLAIKAAPAPVYNWSGCYVGINAGGGMSASNFTDNNDPTDGNGSANHTDFLGGGQAGCNLQMGTVVGGLEGDFDYFHGNPNFFNNTNGPPGVQQSLTTSYLATVRPRLGIAADRNFAYLTGGVAFANASYSDNNLTAGGIASASRMLTGWTAGAGWEYAMTQNWTFKLEYLWASFPTMSAGNTPLAFTGTADLNVQVLRVGANFKF